MQVERFATAGTVLPTKTQIGRIFFLIDLATPSNSKIYASFAVDTWTQIGGAGSVATFDQIGAGINVNKLTVGAAGELVLAQKVAPADATLAASQFTFWLTDTNGSGVLNIKGKTANGTVVSGTVNLT